MSRLCKLCEFLKDDSCFYQRDGKPAGYQCSECLRARQRDYSMRPENRDVRLAKQKVYSDENRERLNQYLSDYYTTKNGRVKSLIKSAKKRGETMGIDIDEDFVLSLMESDRCSVTGIKFDYNKPIGTKKKPICTVS